MDLKVVLWYYKFNLMKNWGIVLFKDINKLCYKIKEYN